MVTDLKNPKKSKVWGLIETPHKIVHYLKIHNRLHFGQARGTSFTIPPLSIEVDWAENSITSELILEGNFTNKEINALTSKLLEHCKKEQDSIELGQHPGHLKALQSQGPDNPSLDEGKEQRIQQDVLIRAQ
eukprot:7152182-Ditylum_brightwellii.AAC.1